MQQVETRGGVFGPGGYGGGIFDGGEAGFGGLGRTESASVGFMGGLGVVAGTSPFVWMATGDRNVSKLETAMNRELVPRGFKPLSVDGQLGPKLCGAIAWLGTLSDVNFDANPDLNLMENIVNPSLPEGQQNVCKSSTYPTRVSGTVFKPPNTFHASLPWGVFDAQTQTVQKNVNNDLDGHGYLPIGTGGSLDAATCGAMKLASDAWGMDYLGEYGQNCQAFQAPTKKAPPAASTLPSTASLPTPMGVKKSGMSTAWVVGGLLGAAALAGVYAMRKK